ncbi:MAG: hypothetical protein JWM21_2585 [Acidobacteria bacterium]|nr:hypothetical protein [Acidobacteriota bacterium]
MVAPILPFSSYQAAEVTSVNSSGLKASTQIFTGRSGACDHLIIRSVVFLLFVLLAASAFGQSGRRGSKSPPVSAPTPEAKPEEKPVRSDQPRVSLLVGANRGDVFVGVPLYLYDVVLQSCTARLKDSSGVNVEVVTKEMTRSDAGTRAKAAKEGYVIWLNLRGEDQMGSYGGNLRAVFIEYMVFEAETGKIKTQGTSYQGNYRQGGVVMEPGPGGGNNSIIENRMRIAAEDAAVRILKALHIASASDIPPH